jgi:hypothetical protein
MQPEGTRIIVRQGHFGECLGAAPPHPAQTLEQRPVPESGAGEPVVQLVRDDLLGAGRRPLGEVERRYRRGRRQHAGGVPDPLVVVLRRVQRQRPPAVVARGGDRHLDRDAAGGRHHQGRLESQLLDAAAAGLVTRPDRQFEDRRARHEHHVGDRVVGEPGMRAEADPAGEQGRPGVGEGDDGAQQRVFGGTDPDRADVARPRAGHLRPVSVPLEGVGG